MSLVARAASLFRPGPSSSAFGPIGIDFALDSIHMVQLRAVAGGLPEVHAKATTPFGCTRDEVLSNPHRFRSLIKRTLEADRFNGRKAVVAIPSGSFRTMSINYKSAADEAQQAEAVLKVMDDRLDGELSDYVIDYLPVKNRSKNDERLALVAISQREQVVELLETARKSRIDVQALEIGPVAISRLVGAISSEHGTGNVLVINSGRRASYLTLISGTDLLFDQEVGFGEHGLIRQLAETLDMSEDILRDLVMRIGVHADDAVAGAVDETGVMNAMSEILKPHFMSLIEEIKRVCLYAAAETRGGVVTQLYLLGSIARWPGSDRLLGSLIDVNVSKIPNPLALFPQASANKTDPDTPSAPELAVATGLSLRGLIQHG